MIWDVNNLNANALKLSGEDRNGVDSDNYGRYSQTTHLGAGIVVDTTSGRIGNMNLVGSTFAGGDTNGLAVSGNVNVESVVNSYENESKRTNKGFLSSDSRYVNAHEEENVASNLQLGKNAVITGNVEGIGSNIVLGENTFVGGKVTTDSRELHNSYYEKNRSKGFNGGVSHGTISAGYGKSQNTYDEKSTVNAKSNLQVGNGSVLNRGAEITATNFEYGNIQINNGDVKYGARIDTRDVHTSSRSSGFTISAGINSPALDRAKQAGQAVSQIKNGDTAGGAMEAINAATGTIKGLADNQGTRQTNYVNGSVGAKGARDAMANSNFYANIGVNAGFTRSRSNTSSHTEGAAVTTLKPMDENSSITYSNVNNITYQGTQAQGGTFIYNNVANIQKEAVELHNSYSSSSSSRGINAGATIGYGHKIQTTGNGGSISASQSNQNTVETIYANGSFKNVNEVHNNTGSMVLNGFNQEGGKLTGNIGKVEVISRQNTSTTTGSSSGMSLGISANGVPSSVNINGSRTNGDRAFVDNQSTFIIGEGSNLHVGTLENTGAVVGKQGNSTFKIDSYIGKDIQNHDTMKTTGGSIGISTGKPKITNVGFNQDSRDKQGITRNTVVGDVEIVGAEGSPINRDLAKANEVTRDTHSSTNINVESQTIEYATNPAKLKEDIGKAKKEIADVKKAIKESINDRGDDNRNFFGQLREVRLSETVNNIAGKRLNEADKSEDVVSAWKDAYKDLGYNLDVKYTTGEDTPEMKNKAGTAYVSKDGVHTIIININAKENSTKAGLIGTLAEEASHIVNGVAGRQIATGTEEKGLESTGRAANAYFKEEYKGSNQNMTYKSDGKIDTSKLGTNVEDEIILEVGNNEELKKYLNYGKKFAIEEFLNKINKGNKSEMQGILVDLLNSDKLLLRDNLKSENYKRELDVYQFANVDTLGTKIMDDGSIKIEIKEKGSLKGVDDYTKFKTEAVREIINSPIKFIVHPIDEKNVTKELELNKDWYRHNMATNYEISKKGETVADIIFYNFNYIDKNINTNNLTYYSIDEKGKSKEIKYKSKIPGEQHEFVGHPYDYILSNKNKMKYFDSENVRKIITKEGIMYLENRYVKIKNSNGKEEYIMQPFYPDEVNTLWIERKVMDKLNGPNPQNIRFFYNKSVIGKEIRVKNLKEKTELFDKGNIKNE